MGKSKSRRLSRNKCIGWLLAVVLIAMQWSVPPGPVHAEGAAGPVQFTAVPNETNNGMVLAWMNPADPAFAKVKIYRQIGTDTGSWSSAIKEGNLTTYTDSPSGMKLYTTYYYKIEAYNKSNALMGEPAYASARLRAGPITFVSWSLDNSGTATQANANYYEIRAEFLAEEPVTAIEYQYSPDGNTWQPLMELSPASVQKRSTGEWYRTIRADLNDVPDGTRKLRAVAKDASGDTLVQETTFFKDATRPAGVQHAVSDVSQPGQHKLTWANPSADFHHVVIQRRTPGDKDSWSDVTTNHQGSSFTAAATPGLTYEYTISVYDAVGNRSLEVPTLTVQSPMQTPVVDDMTPEANTLTNGKTINYSVKIRDDVPVVSILVEVSADGTNWTAINGSAQTPTAKNNYFSVSGSYNLESYGETALRFRATGRDTRGRTASAERLVNVDRVAPPAPANMKATPQSSGILVQWDPVPGAKSYSVKRLADEVNGVSGTTWEVAAPGVSKLDTGAVNKPHTYSVAAKDAAGNTGPESTVSAIKYAGPALTLIRGYTVYTNRSSYELTGKTDPGADVKVNGTAVSVQADGSFSHTAALTAGKQDFTVTATNAAGTNTLKQRVTLDQEKPVVTSFTPADDSPISGPSNELRVASTDQGVAGFGKIEYQVSLTDGLSWQTFAVRDDTGFNQTNQTAYSTIDTRYYWNAFDPVEGIGALPDGPYKFRVLVYDRAGNVSDGIPVRVWVVNNAPYGVVIGKPADFKLENKIEEIKLTWLKNVDTYTKKYRIFRSESPAGDFTELGTTSDVSYSDKTVFNGTKYYYKIQALTNEGVTSPFTDVLEGEALKDTIPPVITYTTPQEGGRVGGTNPAVNLYINENSRKGIETILPHYSTDGGKTWAVIPGSVSGPHASHPTPFWTFSWDRSGFPSGSYLVRFTVIDYYGNQAEKRLNLDYDQTAETPVLKSIESVDGMVVVRWEAITAPDYGKVSVLRSDRRDGRYDSRVNQADSAVTSFTDNAVTPGQLYYYKLQFQDKTGNTAESDIYPVKVVDDAQKPTIHFVSPGSGTIIGGDSITLSTQLSDNRSVTGTKAEYSTDGGATWTKIADGIPQSNSWYYGWNLKGLQGGTYLVRVSAWDAANNIATMDVTYTMDKTVSTAQNLKITGEENAILLKWDPIPDTDLPYHPYRVLRSTTPGGPYSNEVTLAKNETQYRFENLHPTTRYYFVVRTYDQYNNMSQSQEVSGTYLPDTSAPIIVSTTPAAGVTIGGNNDQLVQVNFRDNAGYVGTTATFEYSTDGVVWKPLEGVLNGPNSYITHYFNQYWKHQSLPSGTYKVRYTVRDASGNQTSQDVVYQLDHTAPGEPKNLIGRYGSGIVNLTWEKPADIDIKTYKLYRATSAAGPFTVINEKISGTALSYTDSTIQYGLTYYYKLTAVDAFNQEGTESNVAAAYALQDSVPPTIQNITPANGTVLSPDTAITVTAADNLSVSSITLQVSTNNGTDWTDVGTKAASGNSASFTLETVMAHGAVQVRAVAYDSFGNASTGGPVRSYTLDREGPDKVTGVSFIPGETSVYLKWNPVAASDIKSYTVEQKGSQDADFKPVAAQVEATKHTVTGLERLKTYQFRVVGYDQRGNRGTPSDAVMVTTIYDVEGPVITELTPAQGSFDNQIPLTVKMKDNIGIVGVKLQSSRDRQTWSDIVTIEEGSASVSYTWNTSALAEGVYYVRAVAWDGAGNRSDETAAARTSELRIDHTPPAVPAGFKAQPTAFSVVLSWSPLADADAAGVNVYRSASADGPYALIAAKKAGQSYTDESVESGKTYYYKIAAVDKADLESPHTAPVQAVLASDGELPVVSGITPASGSMLGANPTLKANVSDNYRLDRIEIEYRKKGEPGWLPLHSKTLTGRTATVEFQWNTAALTDNTYEVRMQVWDATGQTSGWKTVEYVFNIHAPAAPVLTGQAGGYQAHLSWTSNSEWDFKEYRLFRSLIPDGEFEKLTTAAAPGYTDKSVNPGVRYYYLVEAVDTYGNSSKSNVVSVVPTNDDSVPPVARIEYPSPVYLNDSVKFSGLKSTDNIRIDRYEWDFGDGETSIIAEPVHAFKTEGTFKVTLKVYDPKGNSNTASVQIIVADQPAKPAGLAGEPGDRKAYLAWTPNPEQDVTGYRIYVKEGSGWVRLNTAPAAETSYIAQGLANGTVYTFAVAAVNAKGIESELSQPVEVTPAVQQVLSVDEAVAANSGQKKSVEGYIVGTTATVAAALPYDFTAPFSVPTTILLADAPNETRADHILVVHLSSGVSRAALNLADKPDNLGKRVWIKGDLQSYLSKPGLTNIQAFELMPGAVYHGSGAYEESSPAVQFNGPWNAVSDPASSGGAVKTADAGGASAALYFKGSSILLFGMKTADSGIADVYLDGVKAGSIDYYSTAKQSGQLLFRKSDLADGNHKLELRWTGMKNPSSTQTKINLDVLVVGAVEPAAPAGLTAAPGDGAVQLAWTPVDGAKGYHIYRSTTPGTGFVKVNTTVVTAASYRDSGLTNGKAYYYRVTAVGEYGLESAQSTEAGATPVPAGGTNGPGKYDDRHAALSYSGTWTAQTGAGHSDGTLKVSDEAGGAVSLTFQGNAVKLFGYKSTDFGKAEVFLDGVSQGIVDYFSSTPKTQSLLFSKFGLASGTHTVKLVGTGTKNPSASQTRINLDFMEVIQVTAAPANLTAAAGDGSVALAWNAADGAASYKLYRSVTPGTGYEVIQTVTGTAYTDRGVVNGTKYYYVVKAVNLQGVESASSNEASATPFKVFNGPGKYDDRSAAFEYSGTWSALAGSGHSEGAVTYTDEAGAAVTLPFYGNAVKLVGYKSADYGIGEVFIDGISQGTIDFYSSTPKPQAFLFQKFGLATGNHILKIVRTGTKHPAASKTAVNLDFAEVILVTAAPANLAAAGGDGVVKLTWSGSEGATGYKIYRSTMPGSGYQPIQTVTGTAYEDRGVTNGTTYYYVVKSINPAGVESTQSNEVSAAPAKVYYGPGKYDDRTAAFEYTGNWTVFTDGGLSEGTMKVSDDAGASVSFHFNGNAVKLVGYKSPDYGIGEVFIDGVSQGTIDYYSSTPKAQAFLFQKFGLPAGQHILKIVRTGNKNPSAFKAAINLDFLEVVLATPAPSGLSASIGNGSVTLSWTGSDGATGYKVYRSTTPGSGYQVIQTVTGTTYEDRQVINGTKYYYVVKAVNQYGAESGSSNEVSATPAKLVYGPGKYDDRHTGMDYTGPWSAYAAAGFSDGSIQAADASGAAVEFLFTGNAVKLFGYKSPDYGIGEVFIDGVSQGTIDFYSSSPKTQALLFSKFGLVNGSHTFKLVWTGLKNPAAAKTAVNADFIEIIQVPAAPAGLTAAGGDGAVKLNWTGSEGAAAYKVYRSQIAGTGYQAIQTVSGAVYYEDRGVVNGTKYFYVVKAVNAQGVESAASNEAGATPSKAALRAAGLVLTAEPADGGIRLSWNLLPDQITYQVYRTTVTGSVYGAGTAVTDNVYGSGTVTGHVYGAANPAPLLLAASLKEGVYFDTSAAAGEGYQYFILAVDRDGRTAAASNTVYAGPGTPAILAEPQRAVVYPAAATAFHSVKLL